MQRRPEQPRAAQPDRALETRAPALHIGQMNVEGTSLRERQAPDLSYQISTTSPEILGKLLLSRVATL